MSKIDPDAAVLLDKGVVDATRVAEQHAGIRCSLCGELVTAGVEILRIGPATAADGRRAIGTGRIFVCDRAACADERDVMMATSTAFRPMGWFFPEVGPVETA